MKKIDNSAISKYSSFEKIKLKNRSWPTNQISNAPIWCSVDLRDGNQALIEPMGIEKKLRFFSMLIGLGFKEIEIGFPSASETEFSFVRKLIDDNLIPSDVKIQVLSQAREHLIKRTFEATEGAKNVIFHLYNSTSTLQREVVFKKDKVGITKIATEGAELVQKLSEEYSKTDWQFEYSPEREQILTMQPRFVMRSIIFGTKVTKIKQLLTYLQQWNSPRQIFMRIKFNG